jgi:multidrug resistance efflux pump
MQTSEFKEPADSSAAEFTPIPVPRPARRGPGRIRKYARAVAGVMGAAVLMALLVNWVATPAFFPKTSDAWMNAPIAVVRAEVEGAARVERNLGEAVKKGDALAHMANDNRNEAAVWRLRTERSNLQAELARGMADINLAEDLRKLSTAELEKYAGRLIADLTLSLEAAEAKIAGDTTAFSQAARVADLTRVLAREAIASRDARDTAVEEADIAQRKLEQSRAERSAIANQLAAARERVFMQRDSPIYLTWALQVQQSLPAIRAKVLETSARLAAAERELGLLESYTRRVNSGAVLSPADGVIWRVNASSGVVGKGEPLFEIAETRRQFVEAHFQESLAKSIYPGARAVIQFSGLPTMTGIVRAFRQSSPTDLDGAYAMKLARRLNQINVYIDLDQSIANDALLGRQCRVLLTAPGGARSQQGLGKATAESLAELLFRALGW